MFCSRQPHAQRCLFASPQFARHLVAISTSLICGTPVFAQSFPFPLYNTPAYCCPFTTETIESVPEGSLPSGWTNLGTGFAGAADGENHTDGGTRGVVLSASPGETVLLRIEALGTGTIGAAIAYKLPGLLGLTGEFTMRLYANTGGTPNTVVYTKTLDLSTGEAFFDHHDTSPGMVESYTESMLSSWAVLDLDITDEGHPDVHPCGNCDHQPDITYWCGALVPLPPMTQIDAMEIELAATGPDALTAYVDDLQLFDEQIITAFPPSVPASSTWGLAILVLALFTSTTIVLRPITSSA